MHSLSSNALSAAHVVEHTEENEQLRGQKPQNFAWEPGLLVFSTTTWRLVE